MTSYCIHEGRLYLELTISGGGDKWDAGHQTNAERYAIRTGQSTADAFKLAREHFGRGATNIRGCVREQVGKIDPIVDFMAQVPATPATLWKAGQSDPPNLPVPPTRNVIGASSAKGPMASLEKIKELHDGEKLVRGFYKLESVFYCFVPFPYNDKFPVQSLGASDEESEAREGSSSGDTPALSGASFAAARLRPRVEPLPLRDLDSAGSSVGSASTPVGSAKTPVESEWRPVESRRRPAAAAAADDDDDDDGDDDDDDRGGEKRSYSYSRRVTEYEPFSFGPAAAGPAARAGPSAASQANAPRDRLTDATLDRALTVPSVAAVGGVQNAGLGAAIFGIAAISFLAGL